MAYCSNCGAYIPDGETVCVACGNNGASQAAQAQATAQAPNDDNFRKEYEKQQEANKEKSEQWAQQAGVPHSGSSTSQNTGGTPTASKPAESGKTVSSESSSKVFAILSYFSVLCLLPFICCPQDEFAKFHGKQGILLLILSLLVDLLSGMSVIATLLYVARIYLMIKGIMNAASGKMEKLPYIGQFADKF